MEDKINKMFHEASDLHDSVNQHYGEPNEFNGARSPYLVHIGEEFDNQIRLHFLKKQNAEFVEKLGLEELDRLAEEHFKIDKQRSIEKYGEP